MSYIQELYKKRSNYSDPDQATMQENSLEKLSSGIYTEGERFIFELLQNAVDAHSASDCLNISVCIQDGYLIFMHNGDAFTNEDIEGICFVGRKGEKVGNTKKIGYKGIGFKSVFGISSKVYIHTANQCFRFDKDYWRTYWNEHWNPSFGPKPADLLQYTMPWQVIPIESEVPICIDEKNANVATYIAIDHEDEQKFAESVKELMQSCRFLIFLKDNNIKMSFTYHGNTQCSIEKRTLNGEVILYLNGTEDSRWMVYQNPEVPLNLTQEQKRRIEKHKSTPDKLKNATSFDLSFAITIEDGKLKKADNAVLYTYLPTSYSFGEGFPFLVNANFITDEGRQHLDVDAEWNKVLISKIPEEYLRWVASFSKKQSNYYQVLPKKTYGSTNDLLKIYEEAMKDAIQRIAFIPSATSKDMLKASDALIDRLGLSAQLDPSILLGHINRGHGTSFCVNSFAANSGATILKSYGVTVFEKDNLKDLFDDDNAFVNISIEDDTKLVKFLHDYYIANKTEQDSLIGILSSTKFLLDSEGLLASPIELQFPSDFENEFSNDSVLLNKTLYERLGGSYSFVTSWLKSLGVKEASDISVIEQVICRSGYITKDNALEVGKFLFRVFQRQNFFDEIRSYKLNNIKLITKKGTIIEPKNAYLGSEYRPEVDLEPFYDEDIFISDDYIEKKNDRDLYKVFFGKLGVSYSLELKKRKFYCNDCQSIEHLQKIIVKSKEEYWTSYDGRKFYFYPSYFSATYAPLLNFNTENHALSKLIWSAILCSPKNGNNDTLEGSSGFYSRTLIFSDFSNGQSFLDGMIQVKQKMPASDGTMRLSRDLFYNSDINRTLAGKYIPIIDIDCTIDESWEDTLRMKRDLKISDLLAVLDSIAQDSANTEDNKNRIYKIYERIIEIGINSSTVRDTITSWAQNSLILSKDDKFISPSELSYITLAGFSAKNQAYIGAPNNKEGVLELLSLMGVKIITGDNVSPIFDGDILNTDIPTRLLSTLPALAVLARDSDEQKSYKECKDYLQKKIENTKFYQCQKINLAYDDSGDTISKITFAQEGKFYFTGELRPAKIEPLLHPLCSFLGIRGKERELFVIMTEPEFSGIIEYLEDKEYDVDDIKSEMLPMVASGSSVVSVGGQIGGGIDKTKQIADSNEAKALVLAKLEKDGFDVSDVDSDWSVIKGVTRDGIAYPLVVKSCKNWDHKLFLNPDEWRQLFKPNSMLWLHLGNSVVAPIKAYELFTYQDKLTLTFDTVNLMMDDRINKIMEVMRYFNNVHLDVATLNPDQHRAEHLEEYLFNANNTDNSDLSTSPID